MPDNRIPPILAGGSPRPNDVIAFLSFEDWLGAKEHLSKEWVRVYRHWKQGDTVLDTYSAMVEIADDKTLATVLSSSEWDVHTDFGNPHFASVRGSEPTYFSGLTREVEKGVVFRPFIFERSFHGFVPAVVELDPEFVRFHNLFFVPETSEYKRVTDDGEIVVVAKISTAENDAFIDVDAYHLRDYLAAKRCALVRYHDHHRRAVPAIKDAIGGEFAKKDVAEKDRHFELWLRQDIPYKGRQSASRLLGKDVVPPLDKPDARHTDWSSRAEGKHATFIIGRDENGKDIEVTCDEAKLSNYFTDRGTPHFLTPVYFTPDILLRYYNEPARFSAGTGGISCLDLWSMPADESPEGLIQVWLGDLAKLPYKEQLHWRQHNVPPKGTISKERFTRDFMAQPVDDRRDPAVNLLNAHYVVNGRSVQKYGAPLFRELDDRDAHIHKTLRVPVTEEWQEFDHQIQAIAKLTVDSLDVSLLEKISGKSQKDLKGSLNLLEAALEKEGVDAPTRDLIMKPLRGIQGLRSSGAAHRKGSNFDEQLEKLGIQDKANREKARHLMEEVVQALETLRDTLPRAKDE